VVSFIEQCVRTTSDSSHYGVAGTYKPPLFNLISAIFVEKTFEYAKLDTAKIQEARYREDVMVGKELQRIVFEICRHKGSRQGSQITNQVKRGYQRSRSIMNQMRRSATGQLPDEDQTEAKETINMKVDRKAFDDVINDPEIRSRLQSLDISVTSSHKLFDILDADDSGSIEIGELAEGFMKLRGPADKGDTVSCLLTVKTLQKTIKEMEADQEKFRVSVAQSLRDLQTTLRSTSMDARSF